GALEIVNSTGIQLGFTQFGLNASTGIVPAEVANIINQTKGGVGKGWGSTTPETEELLALSLTYLESALQWGRATMNSLNGRPNFAPNTLINLQAVLPFM